MGITRLKLNVAVKLDSILESADLSLFPCLSLLKIAYIIQFMILLIFQSQ